MRFAHYLHYLSPPDPTDPAGFPIGSRVILPFYGRVGHVLRFEPYSRAMTNLLVRHDDGTICWYASSTARVASPVGAERAWGIE